MLRTTSTHNERRDLHLDAVSSYDDERRKRRHNICFEIQCRTAFVSTVILLILLLHFELKLELVTGFEPVRVFTASLRVMCRRPLDYTSMVDLQGFEPRTHDS
jgi:hypothetical protein